MTFNFWNFRSLPAPSLLSCFFLFLFFSGTASDFLFSLIMQLNGEKDSFTLPFLDSELRASGDGSVDSKPNYSRWVLLSALIVVAVVVGVAGYEIRKQQTSNVIYGATVSPTPSATPSFTVFFTYSITPSPTSSATPSTSATLTATLSTSPSATPTPTLSSSFTATPLRFHQWQSVASSSDGRKLVAVVGYTSADQIYTSVDSGVSWTPHERSRAWISVASSADGCKLVAVVGYNTDCPIYTSVDSGVSWKAVF